MEIKVFIVGRQIHFDQCCFGCLTDLAFELLLWYNTIFGIGVKLVTLLCMPGVLKFGVD